MDTHETTPADLTATRAELHVLERRTDLPMCARRLAHALRGVLHADPDARADLDACLADLERVRASSAAVNELMQSPSALGVLKRAETSVKLTRVTLPWRRTASAGDVT